MRKTFEPPTIQELEEFAKSIGFKYFDAVKFWHFYETRNWCVGRTGKMSNWKSCVWTWFVKTEEYKDMKAREIAKAKPRPKPEEPKKLADPAKVAETRERIPCLARKKIAHYGLESKAARQKRIQETRKRLMERKQ